VAPEGGLLRHSYDVVAIFDQTEIMKEEERQAVPVFLL
jgi:hypothetical protein